MKLRENLTLMAVGMCAVLTCAIVVFLNLRRCERVDWVERHVSEGWAVSEAWCDPIKRTYLRARLMNRIKIQKINEKAVVLKSGSDVSFYGGWASKDYFYGYSVIRFSFRGQEHGPAFVFRVDGRGMLEICAEIEENITFSEVLENGRFRENEWATLRAVVDDTGGDPRLGRLTLRFDECVDGSDLTSIGWRVKSWFQRIGLIEGTVPDFSGSVPYLAVEDIAFDDLLSSAKTPSAGSDER